MSETLSQGMPVTDVTLTTVAC